MRKNSISRLLNQISSDNNYLVLVFALLMTSSARSFFLTSVSIFLISGFAIYHFFWERSNSSSNFKKYFPYACVSSLFFLTVVSGLWSENLHDYFTTIRVKAPIFVLPLGIYFLPQISLKQFYQIFTILIIFLGCYGLFIIFDYSLHSKEYIRLLYLGQTVPHIRDHVRFTILCAFAFIIGLIILEKKVLNLSLQRIYYISLTLIFIALHIISARSGLFILYASLVVYVFRLAILRKQYLKYLAVLLILSIIPVVAFFTIDSFHQKINYVIWDRQMQSQGNSKTYSDGERWISNDIGLKILGENKILGTGAGDFWTEIQKKYAFISPELDAKMPHNQFIVVAASFGIFGLLVFSSAFLFNAFQKLKNVNDIKYFFYLNMFLAF